MEQELLQKIWDKVSKIDKIDGIEVKVNGIETRLNDVECTVGNMKCTLDSVKEKTDKIDDIERTLESVKNSVAVFENVDRTNIQVALENLAPLLEKTLTFDSRLSSAENLIDLHSFQIDILKKAK